MFSFFVHSVNFTVGGGLVFIVSFWLCLSTLPFFPDSWTRKIKRNLSTNLNKTPILATGVVLRQVVLFYIFFSFPCLNVRRRRGFLRQDFELKTRSKWLLLLAILLGFSLPSLLWDLKWGMTVFMEIVIKMLSFFYDVLFLIIVWPGLGISYVCILDLLICPKVSVPMG